MQVAKHFFTVEEFERMGGAGIFSEDARLELIEGQIVELSPTGSRHASCVIFLNRFLNQAAGNSALISIQNPMQLNDITEPQPDVALQRLRDDFCRNSHPKPQDVLLIIEVSDTTVDYDRLIKLPLYAKAGIPEVWIINLPAEQIEIYAEPVGDAYRITKQAQRGEIAQAQSVATLHINTDEVLG